MANQSVAAPSGLKQSTLKRGLSDLQSLIEKRWHLYSIVPIDGWWDLLATVDEIAAKMARIDAEQVTSLWPDHSFLSYQFLFDYREALRLVGRPNADPFTRCGPNGDDFSVEPRVFFVPVEGEFLYGFAWKMSNNGDTYVVSPVPQPQLNNCRI